MESAAECGSALPGQITATSPQQTRTGRTLLTAILCGRGYSATCPFCRCPGRTPKSNQIPIRMFRRGFLPSKVKVLFLADGVQIDLPCNTQSDHAIACQHGGKTAYPGWFPGLTGRSAFQLSGSDEKRSASLSASSSLPEPDLFPPEEVLPPDDSDSLLDSIRLDSSEETGISVRSIPGVLVAGQYDLIIGVISPTASTA